MRRIVPPVLAAALLASACSLVGGGDDPAAAPAVPTSATAATTSTTAPTTTRIPDTPQVGDDEVGDPFFPGLGNGGYDVTSYDLTLDLVSEELRAEAVIELVPIVPLTQFNLDLVGLTVDRVLVGGVEADAERDGRELIVTPPATLPAATPATVRVDYRGTPEPIEDPAGPVPLGWHTEDWGTYVASEPLGAATWFPGNDHPTDKATFTIRVTVPEGRVAVGPGVLVDRIDAVGRSTFVWASDDPMATYLASVVTGDFAIITTDESDEPQIRHALPTADASRLLPALSSTAAMLDRFEEAFGPYPFDSYGVVAVPEPLTFALENQTLSLFDTEFLTERRRTVEGVLAHELAHQWFGNHVSPATWADIWLNEGFATWADGWWTELDGVPVFDERAELARAALLPPPTDVAPSTMFDTTVYVRGSLVLEALRRTVGDDEFFRFLRTWSSRFGGDVASTDDFLALVDSTLGADAGTIVRSFLFDTRVPELPPTS